MKITTISNIDCLLTEKEVMQIFKITDIRTFRKLQIDSIRLSNRIVRYEPEKVREFIKQKK
jgi:iron only hydrogenase large subunit-like protein